MKTNFIIFNLVLIMLYTIPTIAQNEQEDDVRKAFENYKSAIMNDKGEEAVNYVDNNTIKYYADILEVAKTADSAKIETLNILDKLMVFSIRHRTSKEDILSFDGKSLLIYAIKSGMVGKSSVANNAIGDITIDKESAKGQFMVRGQKVPMYSDFHKENNQWKMDLTSLFPISTMAFKKMADDSGENQNDYLFSILELITNKKPGSEIWKSIK